MGGPETNGHTAPRFSVVIPSHRSKQLGAALHALRELDYPRDRWEAVVVLDGGDDGLAEGVRSEHPDLPLRVLPQPQSGPAQARNTGAMEARGEFIAFTDDDCAPRSDWLAALERTFAEAPGALVGGRTVNGLPENRYSEASQRVVDAVYRYYNPDPETARFLTTSNLAVPAGTYRELGGFDPSFPLAAAEDRDFCDRWSGAGHPLVYAPDAVVMHFHRMNLRTLARQQHNYGRGAAHYRRARRRRGQPSEQVSLRFYRDLLKVAAGEGTVTRRIATVVLAVAAQVVYAAGYLSEELRVRLRRR
jgi:glycosyltransferase involved in cell wall biosynthesis